MVESPASGSRCSHPPRSPGTKEARKHVLKTILIFGAASGALVIGWPIVAGLFDRIPSHAQSEWIGYLTMLVGLSLVFIGVKRYRDRDLGGVLPFSTGFLLGLGMSVVAGVVYALGWEVSLVTTDYAFITDYAESMLEARRAEGASAEELAAYEAEIGEMMASYRNPLFRLPMTFLEIFPVGLLVSLFSAAVLKSPRSQRS